MTIKTYHGLLECPYHKGWIEFDYHLGDKISDLTASIEYKWGPMPDDDPLRYFDAGSWAFFCAQKDGSYLALRKYDSIPTEPPKFEHSGSIFHYGSRAGLTDPGLLELYFINHNHWSMKGRGESLEIIENFSIELPFKRRYQIPQGRDYDAHLVALVAIVGG